MPQASPIRQLDVWRQHGEVRVDVWVAGCRVVAEAVAVAADGRVPLPPLPHEPRVVHVFVAGRFVHARTTSGGLTMPAPHVVRGSCLDPNGKSIVGARIERIWQAESRTDVLPPVAADDPFRAAATPWPLELIGRNDRESFRINLADVVALRVQLLDARGGPAASADFGLTIRREWGRPGELLSNRTKPRRNATVLPGRNLMVALQGGDWAMRDSEVAHRQDLVTLHECRHVDAGTGCESANPVAD